MPDEHVMTWEEMQRLALPPNTTLLTPPPEAVEVPALASGGPLKPDWLDEGFAADVPGERIEIDPEASRAASEREEFGPGPVRFLANLITVNAVLEKARSPRRPDDDPRPLPPVEPKKE